MDGFLQDFYATNFHSIFKITLIEVFTLFLLAQKDIRHKKSGETSVAYHL